MGSEGLITGGAEDCLAGHRNSAAVAVAARPGTGSR